MAKRPTKDLDHAIRNEAQVTDRAELFADLWIDHVYEPDGLGPKAVAMVNARADLVQMFYPAYDGRVPERKKRKPAKQ